MQELQVIKYEENKVLTTQQLADSYETDSNRIMENYRRNSDRYTEGIHYYKLESEELRKFKETANCVVASNINVLYLWTKKGAMLHGKSLNTEKAWELYEMLVTSYFAVKAIKPLSNLEMMRNMLDEQIKIQEQVEQLEKSNTKLEARQDLLEAKITNRNESYFSIAGYCSLKKITISLTQSNFFGKQCAKLSREMGMKIDKLTDPRWGQVNSYHISILDCVFDDVEY